jgi:hypothetical protein
MQTTRAALTDMVETRPQKKDIDGLSNAAAVQIFSGLSCITLQVRSIQNKNGIVPRCQHLRAYALPVNFQQTIVVRHLICPAGIFVGQLSRRGREHPTQRKHNFHTCRWIFWLPRWHFRMFCQWFQEMDQVRGHYSPFHHNAIIVYQLVVWF